MRGDFHIHTTYSDGKYSVQEILEFLKGKIDYFCITDHDSIIGSIEAFNLAKNYDLHSLIGVEISTYINNHSVHVLGYFNNECDAKKIIPFLEQIRLKRIERLYKIKELLMIHFNFDLNISEIVKKNSITRGTIASYMMEQSNKYTKSEIYKMLAEESKAYVPVTRIHPSEAIDLIHKCNGVAIIAHPVKLKEVNYREFLKMNIDGFEAIYPTNSKEDTDTFKKICLENKLVFTAGTDFHYFDCDNHGNLLSLFIEDGDLDKFLQKVNGVNNL